MDKIKIRGRITPPHRQIVECSIELTPLELVEQISHRNMGEILKLINLPKVELSKCCGAEIECQENLEQAVYQNICSKCRKPIKPQEEFEIEQLKPEDFGVCDYSDTDQVIKYLLVLVDKINEIINTLKKEKV